MIRIEFVKFSGSGNDFICIDNRDGRFDSLLGEPAAGRSAPARPASLVRLLCARGMGVGADGVIFACDSEVGELADVSARFFEPDGSEVELCGNGAACFARWALDSGWAAGEVRVLTPAGVVRGKPVDEPYVRVCIPLPEGMRRDIDVSAGEQSFRCDFALTGVPHLVAYVDDVSVLDVAHLGPALRWHKRFAPRGVNANFVQVMAPGELALRTYEFGVESETLACGTGAATAALMAATRFNWPLRFTCGQAPIRVHVRGGDVLRVFLTVTPDMSVTDLCLDTVVRRVFSGALGPELLRQAGPAGAAPGPTQ